MMRMVRLLVLLMAALVAAGAQGQMIPLDSVTSIDIPVLNAKTVAVGKVVAVTPDPTKQPSTYTVTVAVSEQLKGKPQDQVKFSTWAPARNLDQWMDWKARESRLLVMENERENLFGPPLIDLDRPGLNEITKDYKFLRDPLELLRYVRETVRKNPGVEHVEGFLLKTPTGDLGTRIRKETGHARLYGVYVPVDDRVNAELQRMIRSKDPHERADGARKVWILKTPENIALLKNLLRDPAYMALPQAETNRGTETRRYYVRETAFDTLTRYWKVAVPKPVVEESLAQIATIPTLKFEQGMEPGDLDVIRQAAKLETLIVTSYNPPPGLLDVVVGKPGLINLQMPGTTVGDAQLSQLAGLKKLRWLSLDKNPITDDGLKVIASLPSLEEVSLNETEVTDEGLAALRKARPGLKVTPDKIYSPLIYYIGRGDLAGMRRILDRKPSDGFGIQYAAYERNYDATKLLLDRGAPINARDPQGGDTALMGTMRYFDPSFSLIEMLIGRGADVNLANDEGVTPLDRALQGSNVRVANLLLSVGADPAKNEGTRFKVARPTKETFDLLERFMAAKRNPVAIVKPTYARCDRAAYALEPGGSLANWSSQPIGQFTGPLEWTKTPSERPILGPLGQQAATLKLAGLPAHHNVRVEIELFIIGSWDGNGGLVSEPDIFDISVPGVGTLLHSTFFNANEDDAAGLPMQSFPKPYPFGFNLGYTGATEVRTLGYQQNWEGRTYRRDGVYRLSFTFAHDSPELQLVLSGLTKTEGEGSLAESEQWGIGRMVVRIDSSK